MILKFTKVKKTEFIKEFVNQNMSVSNTCKIIGISVHVFRYAMKMDTDFAKSINEVKSNLDALLFNYLLEGFANEKTRYAYLKLMTSNRIDSVLDMYKSKIEKSSMVINKEDIILD